MKNIKLIQEFDDITLRFFETHDSENALNELEDLLTSCEESFQNSSQKYKEEAGQIEQLMLDISNFELAICDSILDDEEELDYESYLTDIDDNDNSEDEIEAESVLTDYGFTNNKKQFSRKNFDSENNVLSGTESADTTMEDATVIDNNNVENPEEQSPDSNENTEDQDLGIEETEDLVEWKYTRLEQIQEEKQQLHDAQITIKQAMEDRLNQYDQVVAEGNKSKILLESTWLRRDMPIYALEIKKWGLQFQQYLDTLNSQKQAAMTICGDILDNKENETLPVHNIMQEAQVIDQDKKIGNQNMLEEIKAQIDQKETEIEAALENEIQQEEQKSQQIQQDEEGALNNLAQQDANISE